MSKEISHASLEDQRKAANFVKTLTSAANKGGTFDSAAAGEFVKEAENRSASVTGVEVPERLQAVLDECGSDGDRRSEVIEAVLDGVAEFTRRHGRAPTGDVVLNGLQCGYSLTRKARKTAALLDSATSDHHEQMSLHPSAPAIGMMSAIAQAIPFAAYAPADIKSNEGRIIIISHQAGRAAGAYALEGSLDGINSGEPFVSSARTIKVAVSGAGSDTYTGTCKALLTDHETVSGAAAAVKVLRGRSVVYVKGLPVAREVSSVGSGNSTIDGRITINNTEHVISGTINPTTGVFTFTAAPALPVGVRDLVFLEYFIDFEAEGQESLAAKFSVKAEKFPIFATAERGIITATIDSQTQFEAETGFSPLTVGSESARTQHYNERHYRALRKMYRIAEANGNTATFNFDWSNQGLQKNRGQIWADFNAVLGARSQQMAEDTVDHGITHLYVSKNVAVQMMGLPREIFEPSGLVAQPGIYRVGRLFGVYEVYYSPKIVSDNGGTSTILCIGTSPTTARNPMVVGDAVAPLFMPRGVLDDMKQGYNLYTRGFTEVNPHIPSALGAALITVTNLF